MKETIVAKAYAQALIQIGEDKKVEVANELTSLNQIINESNDCLLYTSPSPRD